VSSSGGSPKSPIPAPQDPTKGEFKSGEKKLQIADGETGHSMDSLFAPYVRDATEVAVDDPFIVKPHQIANFLRFCELLVRLGTVRRVRLVTRDLTDESTGRPENIKRSLSAHNIELVYTSSSTLHDRQIVTDTGWNINLGRGLDIYKRPDDWSSVGASDFALRPCYQTTIIFHRLGSEQSAQASA
jgi:ATP-dependent Lon protease